MYPDVVELREFYEGELGLAARRLIRERVRGLWPNVAGMRVLGLGYTPPYLRSFLEEAERVFACMPAPQGVTWWPREGPNRTCLCEETALPLGDQAVDRVLLIHSLENTQHIGGLLQEAWRVLAAGGRMIVVVPNRSGGWARAANAPFSSGFSFSVPQLKRLMTHNRFQVERTARALFAPPFAARFFASSTDWIEKQGERFLPALAGVLIMEVSKQIYARPQGEKVREARHVLLPLPELVGAPPTPSATRARL
jgi:SAM-dependent methyltransferase